MKKMYMLFLILSCQFIFAATMPQVIAFHEGEAFPVVLSKISLNRIFVAGEKIIKVRFPKGTIDINLPKILPNGENEQDDSIYLKPKFDSEITLFIITNKHHNFSLNITGDELSGRTIAMKPSYASNKPKIAVLNKTDTKV